MDINGVIAEWVGLPIVPDFFGWVRLGKPDAFIYQGTASELDPYSEEAWETRPWEPDRDTALWHGKGGLFELIEKKELWEKFAWEMANWFKLGRFTESIKTLLTSTPAQLAAALVKVIEEGR